MGVGHVVLAVNKMDLVDFDEACFRGIVADFMDAAASAKFASVTAIPVSARDGDNVIARSGRMPWFTGAPVLACLENLERGRRLDDRPFRLPVQWVNRPDASFRGYAGTIAAGRVRVGDEVTVSGSHASARVRRIASFAGDAPAASVGDAVTIQLDRELDISRGDIVGGAGQPVEVADQFGAHMVWLAATPLFPGRSYLFKVGTRLVDGSVTSLRHRIDVDTREELAATKLELNDVARVNIALSAPVGFEPYAANRHLGGFIVIDRQTNATVGVGMIELRAAAVVEHRLAGPHDRTARSAPPPRASRRRCCGSPGCPAPARARSPTSWRPGCTRRAATPTRWTATTCATA